jgi:glyoxylase-like metal-dependent hydrolase (beta-lactamase superfamily II)
VNRREVVKGALGGLLGLWSCRRALYAQQPKAGLNRLTDKLAVVDAGGANLVAFASGDGIVLVDSGPASSGDQVVARLQDFAAGAKVHTLFNTHYHLDQTGSNERFAQAGAKIIAHQRTKQWMSTDYWVPAEDRYQKARPKAARPTETFLTTGSLIAGGEQINYGYLMLAHTSGDIYVFFRNANVVAVGDVASPVRDPALDYFTGAWIGGRVDAMDLLLTLGNEQTKIVPAYGPVMTRAELKAERDLMEEVRARLFKQVREGDGPKDMLEEGVLRDLPRTWQDPYKFLYDAAKGLWGHHNKLDPNVV